MHLVEVKARQFAIDLSSRQYVTIENMDIFAATIKINSGSNYLNLDKLNVEYPTFYSYNAHGWTGNADGPT